MSEEEFDEIKEWNSKRKVKKQTKKPEKKEEPIFYKETRSVTKKINKVLKGSYSEDSGSDVEYNEDSNDEGEDNFEKTKSKKRKNLPENVFQNYGIYIFKIR